jgi:hypothetical protein
VAGSPSAELCNQVDDNCDGAVDEPFKTGGSAIAAPSARRALACARAAARMCALQMAARPRARRRQTPLR